MIYNYGFVIANAAVTSYSNYKHNLTGKFLADGTITYVSDGLPGSTSDKVITERSGILSHLIVSFWVFFLGLYNERSYICIFDNEHYLREGIR